MPGEGAVTNAALLRSRLPGQMTRVPIKTDSKCLTRHSEKWIPASAGMTERAGAKVPVAVAERSEA